MDRIWMEYIGSRTPDGVVEDFEHQKFYWGPQNNWKCEVPVLLAGMIIQDKGVDKFLPCLAPSAEKAIDASGLKKAQKELARGEKDLEEANLALQKREKDALARDDAQNKREAALDAREREIDKKAKKRSKKK